MALFHVPSAKGGVRAVFMNSLVWYEEYPTVPSSFVLNGFIYSLLGLYDLSVVDGKASEAAKLYNDGLQSLKAMVSLYDTGMLHNQVGRCICSRFGFMTKKLNMRRCSLTFHAPFVWPGGNFF